MKKVLVVFSFCVILVNFFNNRNNIVSQNTITFLLILQFILILLTVFVNLKKEKKNEKNSNK